MCFQPDGNKIALSMKVVNQTTGKDLDPALVQTRYVVIRGSCLFTVAEWLTHSPATLVVMGSHPTLGGISEIQISNRYSLRHGGT